MKKELNRFKVCYTCNNIMYNPLYLSILSIVKRTKHPVDFYIFTANFKNIKITYRALTKRHEKCLKAMIKRHNCNSTLTIIDSKHQYLTRSKNERPYTKHWPPYATFRLLFDMFKQLSGTILYLDPDTMFCDDIAKAFMVNMNKYEMCVTKDIYCWDKRLKNKYFNSGVLLMNMDVIRKTKYLERAFKYMLKEKPEFCDQDALNWTWSKIKFRNNDAFNRIWKSRKGDTVIKHFAGPCPKPWKRNFKKFIHKLNYEIWIDDIDEWKKMKYKI